MALQTQNDVNNWLAPKLQIIVEEILNGIDTLNDEKIVTYVYNAYNPTMYERTPDGENFASAWKVNNVTNSTTHKGCQAKGEFGYDPKIMSTDPVNFQHGNAYSTYPNAYDSRWYLADIIYNGLAGDWFGPGPWVHKRDAWSKLIKAVGTTNMKKWIRNGARKAGLKIKF